MNVRITTPERKDYNPRTQVFKTPERMSLCSGVINPYIPGALNPNVRWVVKLYVWGL